MGIKISQLPTTSLNLLNYIIIGGSGLVCILLMPMHLPGMEILGITPNWILIWLVAWSIKRSLWSSTLAATILGLIHDSLTANYPSHVLSLVLVAVLTSKLQKQRYIQEDFISVALIVFVMSVLAESTFALQYLLRGMRNFPELWSDNQRIALTSAIISSLWAPVLYFPLNHWWENLKKWQQ